MPPAADAPTVLVETLGIRHRERDRPTPAGVDLALRRGEVTLLLGPSGSGKSSLALALDGLIPHAVDAEVTGRVLLDGRDVAGLTVAAASRTVAMVFQNPDAQLVTATCFDEVAFGPENLGLDVATVLERTESALVRVGLWERRGDSPDVLSGGGKQRLAIACALAMASPIIVLDEPTANLDPEGAEEVVAVLGELAASGDHGILLIEHDLDAVVPIVDRVVVLDRTGAVVADGDPDAVLRGRAHDLVDLGVWLPVASLAALRLADVGVALEPLPLTPAELRRGLGATDRLPAPVIPAGAEPIADAEPVVAVHDLTVHRGRAEVLHGVNLGVARGDVLAIVGGNGAGKSTLVQAIAGVIRPPRGRIDVLGLDPARADVRDLSRAIGFVFQNPEHQFITESVAHELAHGLRIRRVAETDVADRVDAMLERFGLTEVRHLHPFLLSGGQKRRLSVGTALIAGAPVLALDEPTFGQDRERAEELLAIIDELHRDGTTVLLVSHDMQLVADHATRVAVVDAGRIVACGPTDAVLSDVELLTSSRLRPPPLAQATSGLVGHPAWRTVTRLAQVPGGIRTGGTA